MGALGLLGRFGRMLSGASTGAVASSLPALERAARPAIAERVEPAFATWGKVQPHARARNQRNMGFAAARWDRLTQDWGITPQAMDVFLRLGLRSLRARSRQLAIDNDYMRAFLRKVRTNVVGPEGLQLDLNIEDSPGKRDDKAIAAIKAEFAEWSKLGNCTVCGRFSRLELEQLVVTLLARDGEFLIREVRGYPNRWGYALQVLAIDQLDETLNRGAGAVGTNEVRMGVEIDAFNRPVAYHVWKFSPADLTMQATRQDVIRIPADEIIHVYVVEDAGQTRGFPWGCSSMRRLAMLGGYEEAALIAARVGASKMGFFTNPNGEAPGPPDTSAIAGERDPNDGALLQDAEPGTFDTLPEGYDLKSWDPLYPHGEMPGFNKHMLRGAASGLGVAYNGWASDLEGVTYSSIRSGTIDERDDWRVIQSFVRDHFSNRFFPNWLEQSLLTGAVALPFAKFAKFNKPVWHFRGWEWVDPKNDIEAAALEIALGLTSRTQIAARRGRDLEQIMREQAAEQALAKKYGVALLDPSNLKGAPWKQAGSAGAPGDEPVSGGADNGNK